ncbi:FAS-associated death domain protein [Solea senegalensis]|uniref:FAS-associated death domain protein n=1 Tax=Solea senegalensis TaxID=28829 RepID=A0AAV6PZQ5_SOLSE|nr:protein FADD [Solea senegalensis]KAG7481665.1 FAS-associated death domain protein [Solea senegalensis]
MGSFQFNSFLLEISNQLPSDQLEKMKFLCKDKIGKKDLEKITGALKLFQILAERGELTDDKTGFLSELLKGINRHDLSEKLDKFHSGCGHTDNEPEKVQLDIATEVIAENLGRGWRKLGRKLGLSDVKLESIHKRHPTELEETVVELLKEWRKSRGAEARTEELLNALRACQYNLTADKVEDKLSLLEN